ncbi:MAG: dTMP kinase [Chloroflexi bacterium]|nr:dTMP kinase [Chloroflexota bacterium]MCH8162351.1 dTMP kinase [Chloroflexota bacterium]MCH8901494.1 dTMP kinase [Chloroflexota bacterium]
MTARFIVLEGLDGSGITTQSESLRIWCEQHGIPVFVTREPTEILAGSLIRSALKHRVQFSPAVMALLFAADRLDHLENEIRPQLEGGKTVISDRYYLSEYAYQSIEVELKWLRELNSECPRPDMTIFIDVPAQMSLKRLNADVWRSSERLELYEEEGILVEVREHYLKTIELLRAEGERIEIVDGSQPLAEVANAIASLVEPLLTGGGQGRKNSASPAAEEIASKLGMRPSRPA